jgi:DNA-binding GntR family transcriptional regulator
MLHAACKERLNLLDISRKVYLGDQVYGILKDRIISGHYEPGELIVESDVANDLKVSRTPVSNAFIKLKERGLIEYDVNRFSVTRLTLKSIIDLYKCRLAFDVLATGIAALRVTDEDLSELEKYIQIWDESSNPSDLWVADLRFHEKIYDLSDNPHLKRFSVIATELLSVYRRVNISRLPKQLGQKERSQQDVISEHREIFSALCERDEVRAENAARNHILNVINNLESLSYMSLD